MHFFKTSMAVAVLVLASGTAQAARLQLIGGTAGGLNSTTVDMADGDALSFAGSSGDFSGLAEVLAFGSATHSATLPTSGLQFSNDWARSASLDASGAVTRFSITGTSALRLNGTGGLSDLVEAAGVGLSADLRVAGDGEADGTAVTVRLQLGADSLFSSSIAGAEDTPTFNLLVQDAAFNTLASYNGLALNGSDTVDLSFSSQVGQTLSLALNYDNTLSLGNAALSGVQTIDASALLDGTLVVTAVPEPHSLALLLCGLGLVVAKVRRRS